MRYSINIPNFGDFADTRAVQTVAAAAESAGWDGLFVWDHVVHRKDRRRGQPFGDPWMLLLAAALGTERIRLGTLVTPVARRRPEQLARQVATLDGASNGRVVFGAGLGAPLDDEFGSFGEPTDAKVLAGRLDESLGLLSRYWSGQTVNHVGEHYRVSDVQLLPATVQQPRPPVWVAGTWPNKRPFRRAARWDGVVPLFQNAEHGTTPAVTEVRDVVDFVSEHRDGGSEHRDGGMGGYEVVVGGVTEAAAAADVIGPFAQAGATWWDERQPYLSDDLWSLGPVLDRIEQGPPRL